MSVDSLLDKVYDRKQYNCLHFAADSWHHLTGDDRLLRVREDDLQTGRLVEMFRGMKRHGEATDAPSLVLMDTLDGLLHIGVCYRRRLLHISEAGCQFLLVDAVLPLYKNMRFYS